METERKLVYLGKLFPTVPQDVLLEVLISCDGSESQTEMLLSEQFASDPKRKRDAECHSRKRTKYQGSILSMVGKDSNAVVATGKTLTLYTKEEIEATVPYLTFKRNFLPSEVADGLLKELLDKEHHFKPNEFYIAGNKCTANHKTMVFSSMEASTEYDVELTGRTARTQQFGDNMTIAKCLVEDEVEAESCSRPKHVLAQREKWTGDIVVANLFEERTSNLDWHSDRLTNIGPLPVIASISVGATREFRLRKIHPHLKNPNPIISIPLPHNTLLIMHEGLQEEYKHCVAPSSTPIEAHPLVGQKRFSLTYRKYHPGLTDNVPSCPKCRSGMLLRRMYKKVENRGKYYWSCKGSYQNKECKGFYWADFRNIHKPKSKVYTTNEEECSEWIADDDTAKHAWDLRHR